MKDELVKRLREDAERLRNLSRLETPFFRWTGELPNGYRMKTDFADDLDALLNLIEGNEHDQV